MRTKDRELLTSKGWINAHWTIDLPREEALHLIRLGRVDPVTPDTPPATPPRSPFERRRKNAALPPQLTR